MRVETRDTASRVEETIVPHRLPIAEQKRMSNDPTNPRRPPDPARSPARPSGAGHRPVSPEGESRPRDPQPRSTEPRVPEPKRTIQQSAARPARPQAPTRPATGPRLEGVLEEAQVQSIDAIIPSGLSTSTYLPSARRDPELERRHRLQRQLAFRQTVIPSALVLCISMFAMAGGWFLLDPTSALRDNPLGTTIPVALALFAAMFGAVSFLLITQATRLRNRIASESAPAAAV